MISGRLDRRSFVCPLRPPSNVISIAHSFPSVLLKIRHFPQVNLDFVDVVIFAAAFSSCADMIQLRSEHESWRILLRIRQSPELFSLRPKIRGHCGFAVSFRIGSDLIDWWIESGVAMDPRRSRLRLSEGKFEEAATAAQQDTAEWAKLTILAAAGWSQKRILESDAALDQLIKDSAETAAYQIAGVYGYRGDKDRAFEWLERARRQRDASLAGLRQETYLNNIKDDPRWNAFLHKMGLADDQLN